MLLTMLSHLTVLPTYTVYVHQIPLFAAMTCLHLMLPNKGMNSHTSYLCVLRYFHDTMHGYHRDDCIPLATQGISKMYSRLTVETVHFTSHRGQKRTNIVIP